MSQQERERKRRIKAIREGFFQAKEEGKKIRLILRDNIIIASISGTILLFLLPILAQTMFIELWTYSNDNIIVRFTPFEAGEVGTFDPFSSFGETLAKALLEVVLNTLFAELRYIYALTFRMARFAYLVLTISLFIYLIISFITSLIMQYRIKFRFVLLSCMISFFISFGLAFILIPNDKQLITAILEGINDLQDSANILTDLPRFATDLVYSFYIGFAIIITINLILITVFESLFRNKT